MSSFSGIQLLRNRFILGGLVVLVVTASTLATLRFLKEERVTRQTVREIRNGEAERQRITAPAEAARAAERERQAQEETEREAREAQVRAEIEAETRRREQMEQARAKERTRQQRDLLVRRQRRQGQEKSRQRQLAEEQARKDAEREEADRREAEEARLAKLAEEKALQEELARKAPEKQSSQEADEKQAEELQAFEEAQDETPQVETESTIDETQGVLGWKLSGDLRPILEYQTEENANGVSDTEGWSLGLRARLGVVWAPLRRLQLGARLAGLCFTNDCQGKFVRESATSGGNDIGGGDVTLDQFFAHWFRTGKFDIAAGRLQTRFVLRGGVFAKSLDRNDSNNVNVTWTDGIHATYRIRRDNKFHVVLQHNVSAGSGSIRRGALDFADPGARITYFAGYENIKSWGPVVQRAVDVSYLPDSVLKDGDPDGRRGDYLTTVGRIALRSPNRREGLRLRAGTEIGYASGTQTCVSANLGCSGDVGGLAWNIVASAMDFASHQSIGVNYARTDPGWYLSPQYGTNEELFEIRHQWYPENFPLVEARVRWRRELERQVGASQKARSFDLYLRLTWQFTIRDF